MRHVVMLSGGVGSWAAAKRVAEKYGTDNLTLLFADTRMEDADTYRFLREGAANVGGELVEIADGRTIWEVFADRKFLGSSRVDPCSDILKRKMCDRWLDANRDAADTTVHVGIDWTEMHRYDRLKARRAGSGWTYEAPLCEPPYLTKDDLHEWAEREGIRKQRLYVLGMPHANCGGLCVKMGIGGFARGLMVLPDLYAEWEANEEKMRVQLGDVSILKDRTRAARMAHALRDPSFDYREWTEEVEDDDGEIRRIFHDNLPSAAPLTLKALRERIEGGGQVDLFDIGGCGCFVDPSETPEAA